MGSLPLHNKLPLIDLSKPNLVSDSGSYPSRCKEVRQALEDFGCFVAVYDGVSLDLHNGVFAALKDLFDLPPETKTLNVSDRPYHGYIGQQSVIPLHESMGIEDANTPQSFSKFSMLMWPEGNDNFCETMLSYSNKVAELDQLVTKMVFESYGVDQTHCESQLKSTSYLLRVMKYTGPKINEPNHGVLPHTDKSFITILHQNEVTGLEVKRKEDDYWIGFQPSPSAFVVMAGDAAFAWSNGRIHSPQHRVTMSGTIPRYSIGIFSYNRGTIDVPQEMIDDDHPIRFRPFDHYGLLNFFFTEVGRRAGCVAKAYCGV